MGLFTEEEEKEEGEVEHFKRNYVLKCLLTDLDLREKSCEHMNACAQFDSSFGGGTDKYRPMLRGPPGVGQLNMTELGSSCSLYAEGLPSKIIRYSHLPKSRACAKNQTHANGEH